MVRSRFVSIAGIWVFAAHGVGTANGQPTWNKFGQFGLSGPIGNTATSDIIWEITDAGPSATYPAAPGTMGGTNVATNLPDRGWSVSSAVKQIAPGITRTGDFYWDATPTDQLIARMQTLSPLTTWSVSYSGMMGDFDPNLSYSWPVVTWEGDYKTHNTAAYPNGPPTDSAILTASTIFPVDLFQNPSDSGPIHSQNFSWSLDIPDKTLSLVYTPMPEPGTFALVALAGGGWLVRRRFSRR